MGAMRARGGEPGPASKADRPEPILQEALLGLLRGHAPPANASPDVLDACLDRYECGGYLHHAWSGAGRPASLPEAWREALARAHRRTLLDNLAALAQFRDLGPRLAEAGVPFLLLKGAAYLGDLYDDPGARRLTDIDLLVRRSDAGRLARRLSRDGFRGEVGGLFPEDRRFEMWRPGPAPCHFEFHWSLRLPFRFGIDEDGIWERADPVALEGVPCRRASREDALLYHVAHQADSYFGPSLKWVLDLREMLRLWRPAPELLVARASAWRVRTALYLALRHLEKILPGEVPRSLLEGVQPGSLRGWLLERCLTEDALELLSVGAASPARYPVRCLMLDRPSDALALTLRVLVRPLERPLSRACGRAVPPWQWAD